MNRIVKRSLIVLAVLIGIPITLIAFLLVWFLTYTYWTVDGKFDHGGAGEWSAVKIAQGYDRIPSAIMNQPCDWNHPSAEIPRCLILSGTRRNICRWWFAEHCQPYEVTDLVLYNPELLGNMIHAIIDPCFYQWQSEKRRRSERETWLSDGQIKWRLDAWCRGSEHFGNQRRSVVVIFKKDSETEALRIRIDFPEGFTTPTREELIKIGDD